MPKTLTYLLLAAVPGLMFCIIPVDGTAFRFSWEMMCLWAGGFAFTALLSSFWLRAFWLCALTVTIISAWPPNFEAYICLMMLAVFLVAAEGFRRIAPEKTMIAMRIAAFALLVWIFLQEAGFLRTWYAPRNAGPFNPNTGGVFLALCLPVFMCGWWWIAVPFIALGIFITKTTTAVLAAVAGVAVYLIAEETMAKKKNKWATTLGAILILLIISASWFSKVDSLADICKADRWIAWKHAAVSMQTNMYGRGLGSWNALFPSMTLSVPELALPKKTEEGLPAVEVFMQAHNEYVQAAFEMGMQTLALILAYLTVFARAVWRGRIRPDVAAGVTILAVSCFGFFTFHVAPTALLGVAWLGMIEGRLKEA